MTTNERPIAVEHNCTTGEIIERPYTDEEIAQREIDLAIFKEEKLAWENKQARLAKLKESAKAKLVAGEPLTEEEASVLVI